MFYGLDWEALMCAFLRALGVLSCLPIGAIGVLSAKRALLALGLALLVVLNINQHVLVSAERFVTEFLVGLLLSLPVLLLIDVAGIFGELFDLARGQCIGNLYDAMHERQDSQSGVACRYFIWVSLLLSGYLQFLVEQFFKSFSVVNLGEFNLLNLSNIGEKLFSLTLETLSVGFILFMPFAVLFMLVDLGAGVLSKLWPQVGFYSEFYQIKNILGFLLVYLFGCSDFFSHLTRSANLQIMQLLGV